MNNSLKTLQPSKTPPEFELIEKLSLEMVTSYGAESTLYGPKAQNHKQIATVLQELASKIGMMQTDYYFRAGKSYFTVNHTMGKAGNLFFKSVFENLLKCCTNEKPHIVTNEGNICVIFRI